MGSDFEGAPLTAIPMRREIAPLRDVISLWRVWRLIQQLKPDLVTVSTPKAGLLGGIAACLARVPCRIYVMRGLRLEGAKSFQWMILFATEWLACHTAQRVFCVSASLMQRTIELGVVERKRCAVLGPGSSNGVDLQALAPSRGNLARAAELRSQWDVPSGEPVIGFIGRCTADKGVAELIEAYAIARQRYPELRLLIAGNREELDPRLWRRCQNDPQLICCDQFVADTAPLYHAMDFLVLPTHREGFPNVILEAHAAGKTVISTRVTGVVDVVEDGVSGLLVHAGDVAQLAEAMLRLLANPELSQQMGAAGRKRAQAEFSRERIWHAVEREYVHELERRGLPLPEFLAMYAATAGVKGG